MLLSNESRRTRFRPPRKRAKPMRRTKMICTIGPASSGRETLARLVEAGMDVARLNFSHGSHDAHASVIEALRDVSRAAGRPVAILQDLAGPKVRVGNIVDGAVELVPGRAVTFTDEDIEGDASRISLTYKNLSRDVRKGDALLLSDGDIELEVEEVSGRDVVCRVVVGGTLHSHKGLNLPAGSISAPILGEKDRSDLAFGLAHGVDFVALSFVRSADDVREARAAVGDASPSPRLLAKIEKHEALENMDEILAETEGLMIARGDLGVEIPFERVPGVQKTLIRKANLAGKPVITATHMLKSMVANPRPTRAEVSDVANAILDGSDAVMLSEETAVGRYPVKAVEAMSKIASGAEDSFPFRTWFERYDSAVGLSPEEAVAFAACQMADRIGAAAIVTFTRSGSTCRLVSKYRPAQPILAMTPEEGTLRSLSLVWGAVPMLTERVTHADDVERTAVRLALDSGRVRSGEQIVITAGLPVHVEGTTNLIKVATAGE